jgi:hypothetical protein
MINRTVSRTQIEWIEHALHRCKGLIAQLASPFLIVTIRGVATG